MGEAVLRHVAKQRGNDIYVDSCGTGGYHVGDEPDDRTLATLKKHGIPLDRVARQVCEEDFRNFTHILAADNSNLGALQRMRPRDATASVELWGSYLDGRPIADPYYGGVKGFEQVYNQCTALSHAFLDKTCGQQKK
ncbi:phosphotyrosine protein phosphatase I superfamily [Schizophyllum fasciatum]